MATSWMSLPAFMALAARPGASPAAADQADLERAAPGRMDRSGQGQTGRHHRARRDGGGLEEVPTGSRCRWQSLTC